MDDFRDFKTLHDRISNSLVKTTRNTGQICAEDLAFQRSLDSQIGLTIDKLNARLLNLTGSLLRSAASGSDVEAPLLQEVDDVDNSWKGIIDVIDALLEKADTCLDEYTGVIKRQSPPQQGESHPEPKPQSRKLAKDFRSSNETLAKPQLHFHRKVTNDETSPFKPLLKSKPHALVSREESLVLFTEDGKAQYKHPYEEEICQLEYPPAVFEPAEPLPYQPFDSTTATWVDTPEGVLTMLGELKGAKEIAIDLEHHDTRSYVGIVSLMQISTREKDWIVDTLKPWREDLQVLNEVFADPRVLKVFHGAYMDMVWLQRDLGLYVVGLFDTYHAARALGYPQASLASLLTRFVHFNADKQYQMADWRVRPLPEAMFNYARSDTHFLLFIYDHLRNQLIAKSTQSSEAPSRLEAVLSNSKETSLLRYERYVYDEDQGTGLGGWLSLLNKTPALFSNEQFSVFKAVHQWRDKIARQNDDSVNYVMPKHVIFSIARATPVDLPSLLGVSHPISPIVRIRATELLGVIKRAKDVGAAGPSMVDTLRPRTRNQSDEAMSNAISKAASATARKDVFKAEDLFQADPSGRPSRSNTSQFWGPAFGSTFWDDPKISSTVNEDLRLAVPLPQLTAEIFEDIDGEHDAPEGTPNLEPGSRAEHRFSKDRQPKENHNNDVFVVKDLGGGRKRKQRDIQEPPHTESGPGEDASALQNGSPPLEQDEIGIEVDDDGQASQAPSTKAERRAARKVRKRMEKGRQIAEDGQAKGAIGDNDSHGGGQDSTTPFDYATATSILHAKRDVADRPGSKKPFDPYIKSANAAKGLGRARREMPGRSRTFQK
ncbi:MAG: exosome nuclease subunit [Sclerophora amabilis]|nr:MAG: exosome nuclease subunit [Sclerophora amabilis]